MTTANKFSHVTLGLVGSVTKAAGGNSFAPCGHLVDFT